LLSRRDDSPEFGQFRLEGRDLYSCASLSSRLQLGPSIEKEHNTGFGGDLSKVVFRDPAERWPLEVDARIGAPSVAQSASGTTNGVPLAFVSRPSAIWKSAVVLPVSGGAIRIKWSSDVTATASEAVVTGSSNPSTSSVCATEADGFHGGAHMRGQLRVVYFGLRARRFVADHAPP
jgi:hypothetical protein